MVTVIRSDIAIGSTIGNRGKSYLQSRALELNRTARSLPVFMMIDLDSRTHCPLEVRDQWFKAAPQPNMLFRVAVMEVESWILADRVRCATFLGVQANRIPHECDSIQMPKEFIVNLARRSRKKSIREDMVPALGATISFGPAYNARLTEFIERCWDPTEAATNSESLDRALRRLEVAF